MGRWGVGGEWIKHVPCGNLWGGPCTESRYKPLVISVWAKQRVFITSHD